ncbi:MAG: zinc ribbon domain-containing protein [Oscillospiraceae bacterium]|nr:zinc ribbon domain-containing protein [Oscillospiraceae bacterium]
MTCTTCGTVAQEQQQFCAKCGAKTTPPPMAEQSTWQPQPRYAHAITNSKPSGRWFLLVVGILYIVFGAAGVMYAPLTLADMNVWLQDFGGETMRGIWSFYYIVSFLLAGYMLLMGIMAVTHWRNVLKARLLQIFVIIEMALVIALPVLWVALRIADEFGSTYFMDVHGRITISSIFDMPFGLVLPILYFIGASKNRRGERS